MFADLDDTIRELLIRHVPLDPAVVEISFEAPDRGWSGQLNRPAINCFLYDVRENHTFRETDWDAHKGSSIATLRKAPVRINVTYQITAWARAPEDEHRLLWHVLATLFQHPVLPDDLLQGALAAQPFPVPTQVAQPGHAPQNYAELWQALENRIRPSLTYVVTLALDPEVIIETPLVFTRVARLRDGPRRADAQPVTETFAIGGQVRGRQGPAHGIRGAFMLLRETGAETTTDAAGRFTFPRAPRGPVTLVVRLEGPETATLVDETDERGQATLGLHLEGHPEVRRQVVVPSSSYDIEL